ncbi:MAG: hypothetical protein HY331_17900 [Chloroflexi bacterium]|nr:hypothetical protein [Chloroflexota bacterium]
MTIREELHHLVDVLDEEDAREALEYIRWLLEESETLTDAEMERVREGEAQINRGEYVTLDELQRELRS